MPPHLLPYRLDVFSFRADQDGAQALVDQRKHSGTAGTDCVGVADTLRTIGIAHIER